MINLGVYAAFGIILGYFILEAVIDNHNNPPTGMA